MFSKKCPLCGQDFNSLESYVLHIKERHEDVSPKDLAESGKEQKWKLKGD